MVSGRNVLTELCSPEGFARAMEELPPDVRDTYVEATSLSWVPITVLEQVVEVCGRELGRDPFELNDQVSRVATERAFGTVWRVFLRFTSDNALISRTPVIYSKTYDTGRIVPNIPARGVATIDLVEFPNVPEFVLRPLGVGIQTTLRCAGRRDAHVTYERVPGGARYSATWQA